MDLQTYDLSNGTDSERFMRDCYKIIGVEWHMPHKPYDDLFDLAWSKGWEGGPEEVLLMFWDLCEAEGL